MTKKRLTKKSAALRTSRAKAAVQKGAKFEDTVADLYRLLGADVIQNIEICQKKVDILATFQLPGSPTGHRMIVECKDERKPKSQNQRVMQFVGLLNQARKTGVADSSAIITRSNWSDQAKGFAKESGIELLTYEQKIAQLINLTGYLKDLTQGFEKGDPGRPDEPPLGAYYVDLCAEQITQKGRKKIGIIDKYIHQWLGDNSSRHLAILGEYGTGKTSFVQKLTHDLASVYLTTPGSGRIPILFNLREFTKTLRIESLVTSFLDQDCGVINPRFRLFEAMNEAGIFLLIFDGFDEMAVRVDVDTLEINLQEIEKLASAPMSKVIITSRVEYFISSQEEKKALCPKGELLATRGTEYEPLRILPWEDEQVNLFLKKRVPLIKEAKHPWTYYRDRIRDIPGLADLSRRPVLLDMIAKTLPQLIASGKEINRPNLYETYLSGEIKRQKIMKKRTLLLSESARFSLLQRLALDFYGREAPATSFTDAQKYIRRFVKPPSNELEAYTRDFLTCSFLVREGDHYRFSHRSIMEYLTAKGLMEEISKNHPRILATEQLDTVVAKFLTELKPDTNILWNWLKSTKSEDKEDYKYLGGNAATILCKLDPLALAGKDLSGTNLTGADLSFSNLIDTDFSETIMKNVTLVNSKFLEKNIHHAKLSSISISIFYVYQPRKGTDKTDIFSSELREKAINLHIRYYSIEWTGGDSAGNVLCCSKLNIPNLESLESIRSITSTDFLVHSTAVYADEHEKLLEIMSDGLREQFFSMFCHQKIPF